MGSPEHRCPAGRPTSAQALRVPPRTALVTGASSGIGMATAQLLLDRGHRVFGTSRNPDSIPAESRIDGVTYRALDLTDIHAIEGFVVALAAEGFQVDIVVNNAGESQSGPLEDLPIGALERLFRLNVIGPVHLTQLLLLPGMRARGYGRVVMVGSMLASSPLAYRSSYVATKAAIKGFAVGSSSSTVFALRRALPRSMVETVLARKFGICPKAAQKDH